MTADIPYKGEIKRLWEQMKGTRILYAVRFQMIQDEIMRNHCKYVYWHEIRAFIAEYESVIKN